jgi:hypothetical protein
MVSRSSTLRCALSVPSALGAGKQRALTLQLREHVLVTRLAAKARNNSAGTSAWLTSIEGLGRWRVLSGWDYHRALRWQGYPKAPPITSKCVMISLRASVAVEYYEEVLRNFSAQPKSLR